MFDNIIVILVALCVIAIPFGIILGIVMAVKASSEQDKIKKNKSILFSVIFFIGPIIILVLSISLWGLFAILKSVTSN